MNRSALVVLLFALGSAARAQTAAPAALTNIGIAAAVRGAVRAAAPNQVGRVIGSGQPVYLNDHVTTGPDGRLQLLLLDETTFTIGPNSDMVLDQFVYDPKTGLGTVSANILKGVFRFVTGKIAQRRPANMRVTLPVGTIGIRGTMVAGTTDGHNADVVLVGPGPDNNAQERPGGITIFNKLGSTDVNSSGYGVSIHDGGGPGRAFRFTRAQLEAILSQLEAHQTAGNGGPDHVFRRSGDDLAQGGINYRDWQNLNQFNQTFYQSSSFASQQAGNPGSNWNDILAIQSGQFGYFGSGTFTCAGSSCVSILGGTSGTFSWGMNVYFNTRTIAGDGVSTINVGGDIVYPNAINYSNFGGKASYTFTANDGVTGSFGNYVGTSLSFLKANGQPAGAMQLNLIYTINAGGGTATGSGKAPQGPYQVGG
jgi:hypothetical protein